MASAKTPPRVDSGNTRNAAATRFDAEKLTI